MIIFDTNALHLIEADSVPADIVRKLRASGIQVAVPWMVMEELAAHKARMYPTKHKSAVDVLAKLDKLLPWELKSSLEPLDPERLLNHWRGAYGAVFDVIETSGEAARRALSRESMGLLPAKPRQPDKYDAPVGGRDAAIWFSVLEFLETNPEQEVHFVTNNTKDFGDGKTYPYPLNEDVRGLEGRLKRLADFAEVVSTFTEEVSGEDAKDAANELLRSRPVRSRVAQTAMEHLSSPVDFDGLGADETLVSWSAWVSPPEADLLSVDDVTGHKIGDDVWYTANAQWLLYGIASDSDGSEAQFIACTWEMKILFSSGEAESLTALETAAPCPPDTSDAASLEILQRLKKRVQTASRRAVRNALSGTSSAEEAVAQHLSRSLPKIGAIGQVQRSLIADQVSAALPKFNPGVLGLLRDAGLARQAALGIPGLNLAVGNISDLFPPNTFGAAAGITAILKNSGFTNPALAPPMIDYGLGKNLGLGAFPPSLFAGLSRSLADSADEDDGGLPQEDDAEDPDEPDQS
ncbi:PIN domain-containing protein [Streptomyces sp. NPDC048484]|uniref:PIN domain-containing protein n=1 Tax=Streptomyces sp. NPDC048484 TaxID=3155146 RepID=UPI00343D8A72